MKRATPNIATSFLPPSRWPLYLDIDGSIRGIAKYLRCPCLRPSASDITSAFGLPPMATEMHGLPCEWLKELHLSSLTLL